LRNVPNPDKVKDKLVIVPNGLRVDAFKNPSDKPVRNPYRFVYASCYTRGLLNILENVWPIIYAAEPRAELHCYYGLQSIRDENLVKRLRELLAQPGVMDHGRQSMDMIIREKYMSNFHFYWTNSTAEIDCISIRESLITGCIPILSKFGVFKERDGIHLDTTPGVYVPGSSMPMPSPADNKRTAEIILSLLKDSDKMNKVRAVISNSKTILTWENVASQWFDSEFLNSEFLNSESIKEVDKIPISRVEEHREIKLDTIESLKINTSIKGLDMLDKGLRDEILGDAIPVNETIVFN
jgi:hypothetical protein